MTRRIQLYDTTLRDGSQSEDINLTAADKLKIALKLDEIGIDRIEGGWPGSNPVDVAFFKEIANYHLKHAVISAFGSTHHPNFTADSDPNLRAIAESGARVASIFGKSCEVHAAEALRLDAARNLEIIGDSVAFLKGKLAEVYFDAEHFFDGYKHNAAYAQSALRRAHEAGADVLVLCDTNGGTLPHEVARIVAEVREALPGAAVGIHAHNDCELAVANSIAAVQAGAVQIQGTINGVGERCGNANLCSIIPTLELKFGGEYACLPEGRLQQLTAVAAYVSEVANIPPFSRQPYVGRSAFAHKGGVHVSAVNRKSSLYEHISPDVVGNRQRILITELAGRSNIVSLARRFGFHLDKDEPVVKGLLTELKKKASLGYDYAAAEASVELLILRKLARRGVREFFRLLQFRVLETKHDSEGEPVSEVSVMVDVEGVTEHTAATGRGPVNALDNALRKALLGFYPRLSEMRLLDFKVRVLTGAETGGGTASTVRVLIESGDSDSRWVTVGVSFNIIEASWQALADSVTYKLYKDEHARRAGSDGE
ncbi:citramalate synthase [Desulfovibrio oxamicus]|uniref:Citramalate synthase n=1 Tax=Nitratidesulfovibrio oxamicus TaxID=32016 RepID=A0ABS0J8J3_9BACT|nr:citramalate synthase [Nitratidesulfovibrio oxamicus]MBG3878251.1 citramalate synthase [Nitratidesulfovibrio oxamicus]